MSVTSFNRIGSSRSILSNSLKKPTFTVCSFIWYCKIFSSEMIHIFNRFNFNFISMNSSICLSFYKTTCGVLWLFRVIFFKVDIAKVFLKSKIVCRITKLRPILSLKTVVYVNSWIVVTDAEIDVFLICDFSCSIV